MTEYNDEVLKQQEEIRQSGQINMLNMDGVRQIAMSTGSVQLAAFINESSTEEYVEMAEEAVEQFGP